MNQATEPEVKDVDIEELEEHFKQFLYSQNGKVTNERLALLRLIYEHDGHHSVDEILDLLKKQSLRVSRATVYRTLDLLHQCGMVRRLALENQETRYEASLTSGHHDHIICLDCHKIIEFFNPRLEQIQDEILAQHQLEPVKHIHQLYGKCIRQNCPDLKKNGKSKG